MKMMEEEVKQQRQWECKIMDTKKVVTNRTPSICRAPQGLILLSSGGVTVADQKVAESLQVWILWALF
jgi:hypothetical protein